MPIQRSLLSYNRPLPPRNATPRHAACPPASVAAHPSAALASATAPTLDDIRRGLDAGEFVAYFQPKVDLRDGSWHGAEVLARWQHPRLGLLTPGAFLPAMEAAPASSRALFTELFARMFGQGLALQRELSGRAQALALAFNLRPEQLAGPGFADDVGRAAAAAGLPLSGLAFEVVEADADGVPVLGPAALETLRALRRMGCALAMDDFGQGHSSLARLCEFPFDQIKLDAAFVRALEHSRASRAVARASLLLTRELAAELIAEGVETSAQRQRLLAMGCRIGQGFGLAPPMAREALLRRFAPRAAALAAPARATGGTSSPAL
ncbi:EAL domain-containing protein [Cupriavidus sp. USMAA2-4]|uniref:EAL domain-containing protein n=1 Tax=Cupriavidus sp. USMAA2-4 TaxID=876364 RepID=UPI0009FC1ED5|nr:EAL domain-containing protein [Cupriavidus sp. USMAA2-4]